MEGRKQMGKLKYMQVRGWQVQSKIPYGFIHVSEAKRFEGIFELIGMSSYQKVISYEFPPARFLVRAHFLTLPMPKNSFFFSLFVSLNYCYSYDKYTCKYARNMKFCMLLHGGLYD